MAKTSKKPIWKNIKDRLIALIKNHYNIYLKAIKQFNEILNNKN
mgnify:CR=1 FL=1